MRVSALSEAAKAAIGYQQTDKGEVTNVSKR